MFKKLLPLLLMFIVTMLLNFTYSLHSGELSIDYNGINISSNLLVVVLIIEVTLWLLWLLFLLLESPLSLLNKFKEYKAERQAEQIQDAFALFLLEEFEDCYHFLDNIDAKNFVLKNDMSVFAAVQSGIPTNLSYYSTTLNFYNIANLALKKDNLDHMEEAFKYFKNKYPKTNIAKKIAAKYHLMVARKLYEDNQLKKAADYLDGFAVSPENIALKTFHAEIELELNNSSKCINIIEKLWDFKADYNLFKIVISALDADSNIVKSHKLSELFNDSTNKNTARLYTVLYLLGENLEKEATDLFEQLPEIKTNLYFAVSLLVMLAKGNIVSVQKLIANKLISN